MEKNDPPKSNDAEERPLATPYELADIALRLAASESRRVQLSGHFNDFEMAWQFLDRARSALARGELNWPENVFILSQIEVDQLEEWMSFPGAEKIGRPQEYPITSHKAAALVSGSDDKGRRAKYMRAAHKRATGTMPSDQEMKSRLETDIKSPEMFWKFARWLAPVCPRFKVLYSTKK